MARGKKETRRGVIYARYSSHNQKEESIEQQVAECTAFAAVSGITIVQVYADKAVSGRTDRRSSFQRMLKDAEGGGFDVVIAYKSNRIARNMLSALTYESKLAEFGIETLYAKEEFGNTAAGRFALRTMMNVNQFYSENMAEDIRRGMRDNAENCKVNGMVQYGYRRGPDGKYEIDPARAEVVREIFNRYLSGDTLADIARSLNARAIHTVLGGQWNKNSFHRLLRNDVYIGVYRHSGVVVPGGVPAILDTEVFEAMQKKLESQKPAQSRQSPGGRYLLTGKLFCGECGAYMVGVSGTGKSGSKHHYYKCNGKIHGECHKQTVRRGWIEQQVAELAQQYILDDATIEWIADSAVAYQRDQSRESELTGMQDALADRRRAAKNIMDAIEQGIFTATTKDRLLEIEADISALEREIAIHKASHKPVDRDGLVHMLQKMRDGNPKSKKHQAQLIEMLVKAVYLWDDRIRIDFHYTGKDSTITRALEDIKGRAAPGPSSYSPPSGSPHIDYANTGATIYITDGGFVLLSPICYDRG